MNTTTTAALQLTHLHKHFGKVHAVDGIELNVPTGTVMALLGPNGAGKTTTLDMVLGLTEPTSGQVRVLGGSPKTAISHGKIAAVLQTGGLLKDMYVSEVVRWIAAAYGHNVDTSENRERVISAANLEPIRKRKIGKCSGGEQQRIKFALALLPNPDLLILDEPTAGMDANARHDFWEVMHRQAQNGKTIVFATHYLQEASDYADRIVVMNHGKIIADASPAEITAQRTHNVSFQVDPSHLNALAAQIQEHWPQESVEIKDDRMYLSVQKSDDFARFILSQPGVSHLEIVPPSMEDTFFTLTSN